MCPCDRAFVIMCLCLCANVPAALSLCLCGRAGVPARPRDSALGRNLYPLCFRALERLSTYCAVYVVWHVPNARAVLRSIERSASAEPSTGLSWKSARPACATFLFLLFVMVAKVKAASGLRNAGDFPTE